MIKNIIFDLGNVILKGYPKDILDTIDINDEDRNLLKNIVFENPLWVELDLGKVNKEEYYEKIKENIPENLRETAIEALESYVYKRGQNEDMLKLLYKLFENKYNIYILSDMDINTFNYLKETTLNTYIKGWCVSSVYGKTKENRQLFSCLLEEFNLLPEECYFIDDKEPNIDYAQSLGIRSFTYYGDNRYICLLEDMKEVLKDNIKE